MNFWSFWFGFACSLVGIKWLFNSTEIDDDRSYPIPSSSRDEESRDEVISRDVKGMAEDGYLRLNLELDF